MIRKLIKILTLILIGGNLMILCSCKSEEQKTNETNNQEDNIQTETDTQTNQTPPEEFKGFTLEKTLFTQDETIVVNVTGYGTKYALGLYDKDMYEPGRQDLYSIPAPHFKQKNIKRNVSTYEFETSYFKKPGEYYLYLYDATTYHVEQKETIRIWDNDSTDYKIKNASFTTSTSNGNTLASITIIPSDSAINKTLKYRIYWTKDNERLVDYTILKEYTHTGNSEFKIDLNENLIMPQEANGIEVSVFDGLSTSYFLEVENTLKLPESTLLYTFQAISDIHVESYTWQPYFASHYIHCLNDIKKTYPNTTAIFTVGDLTNKGKQEQYDVLNEIINNVYTENKPNMYYSIGNHEYFHQTYTTNEFDKAINLYLKNTKMTNNYYSLTLNGNKFIVLGSESAKGEGEMTKEQIEWFKNELAQTNKNEPVFIFMHQGLYDTVSGTLPGQNWNGFINSDQTLRNILKEYPNAFVFSGHTHWSLDSLSPVKYGNGVDSSFINTASVAYLWDDEGNYQMGSQGIYVEVYEDYILIKGREFTEGKWVSATQILLKLTK